MKFHATVVFEFNAPDVAEAGERLNELLEHAQERDVKTRSVELATPPDTSVTLPQVAAGAREREVPPPPRHPRTRRPSP